MKIEEVKLPLLTFRPERRDGPFIGQVFARKVVTYSGCTVPPRQNTWMILEYDGYTLPIKNVTGEEIDAIREDEQKALNLSAPLLTLKDMDSLAVRPGSSVIVEGILAPLFYSGTVGLAPVYGVCAAQMRVTEE